MLVLTRHVNESILIGDEVTITVISVKGNQVRVGISAPSDVDVHREEVYLHIKAEKQADKEEN